MAVKNKQSRFEFEANKYPLNPGLRLIEASAGTGKTFTLAHLVLRLLTEGRNSINEILVVTFTEAAAAEQDGAQGLKNFLGRMNQKLLMLS